MTSPVNEAEGAPEHEDRPTLLAATDGSEAALQAGERAALLAKFLGAKLFVLYVVDKTRRSTPGSTAATPCGSSARPATRPPRG